MVGKRHALLFYAPERFGRTARCSGSNVMAALLETSTYAALGFTTRQDAAEFLVERAMPYIKELANPSLMDLGCGTGAVVMAAMRARSDLRTIAVDISWANVR